MKKNDSGTRDTKSKLAYDILYRSILSGEIPANTKLNVSAIAQKVGVSEIPVREALKRLASDEVLEYIPYCGYMVPSFTMDKLKDLWVIKVDLELLASRLAVEACTDQDIATLEQNLKLTKELVDNEEYNKFFILNKDFHLTLYSFSRNELLCKLIKNFWDRTEKVRGPYPFSKNTILVSIGEHEQIIEALKNKDTKSMEALIYRQREKNWSTFLEMYKQHQFFLKGGI